MKITVYRVENYIDFIEIKCFKVTNTHYYTDAETKFPLSTKRYTVFVSKEVAINHYNKLIDKRIEILKHDISLLEKEKLQ
jgi:hypothetical protein